MRKAFSFIELVVSIVVIGIVFMSVPLILTETKRSTSFSIQQEGVMAAVTGMSSILSHRWDEADTNRTLNGGYAKVCDVSNGSADLNRTYDAFGILTNRRKGHFKAEYRRKFFDYTYVVLSIADPLGIRPGITYATPSTALGIDPDDTTEDDIDDFNGKHYTIEGGGAQDYKYHYDVNISVGYIPDDFNNSYDLRTQPAAWAVSSDFTTQMTNIKLVKISLTSTEGTINMYAFSSNIGEYKIKHERK